MGTIFSEIFSLFLPFLFFYGGVCEESSSSNGNFLKMGNDWYQAYSDHGLDRDLLNNTIIGTPHAHSSLEKKGGMGNFIAFPAGIELKLDPELKIPVISDAAFGVSSDLKLSFPFTFKLDKLFLSNFDDDGAFMWVDVKDILHHRKRRNIQTQNETLCRRLALQKLAFFQKTELFMNSQKGYWAPNNQASGKACLRRVICEIYHSPFIIEQFGIFGNVLKELFRSDQVSSNCDEKSFPPFLHEYAEAQRHGVKGNCQLYRKRCSTLPLMNLLPSN